MSTPFPSPPPRPRPLGGKDLSESEKLKRSTDLTIGLIVMIFNIFEIILISRIKGRKKKNYEIVLLSLCVADLLFGLSNAAVCVVFLVDRGQFSVLEIFHTTYFYFVLTSILHLTFIGADRVAAVVKPIKHKIFMTRKKLYVILAFIWIVSTISAVSLYVTNAKTSAFIKNKLAPQTSNFTGNGTLDVKDVTFVAHNTTKQNNAETRFMKTSVNNPTTTSTRTTFPSRPTNPPNRRQHPSPRKPFQGRQNQRPRKPPPRKGPGSKPNTNGKQPPTKQSKKKPPNGKKKAPNRRKKGPLQKPPRVHKKADNYKAFMQKLLSCFILAADVILLCFYMFIMNKVHQRKQHTQTSREQNEQVSLVCVMVAGVFVTFTLPYAIKTLVVGNACYWVNILLVSNSALNCVVYFFRSYCENKNSNKKDKYTNTSSAMTPMTTPLAKRGNLLNQGRNSPTPSSLGSTIDVSSIHNSKSNPDLLNVENHM